MVSIVIPNMNGENLIRSCLSAVYSSENVVTEVIVVDNASDDQSLCVINAEFPSVKVIANDVNLGFAEACNQGASEATGELLLFLNNDVFLFPETILGLVEVLTADMSVAVCQPRLVTPKGEIDSLGSYMTRSGFLHHLELEEISDEVDFAERFSVKGACMLMRKSAFNDAGGFDSSYFAYFEESDLCWRLRLRGWRTIIALKLTAVHIGGATTVRFYPSDWIDYLSFRNRITTILKNAGPILLIRMISIHFIICLIISIIFLIRGKPDNSFAIIRAIYWNVVNFRVILQERKVIQSRRLVSDSIIEGTFVVSPFSARIRLLKKYLVRW